MVSRTVMFKCDEVLPMKAVAVMIQKASSYKSEIWISKGEKKANAKSLLGVMSLGIECNTEIQISGQGEDEKEAVDAIASYLENPKT